jgi:hypothetical protein
MMRAQSEAGFYLLESVKVLVAIAPIALILLGAVLLRRSAPSRPLTSLVVVTALWLVATFFSRIVISSPVMHHYLSGTFASGEAAEAQTNFYFALQSFLWIAQEISFFLFGITLFLVFRARWRTSGQ